MSQPDTERSGGRTVSSEEVIEQLQQAREALLEQIQRVIIGQEQVIEEILITMFCRGHGLVVGVPGLAKTLMVKTIANIMHLKFKRIQFTPDLMPSDITGTEILEIDPETQKRRFRFIKGPIFTNILLADEINRTPPKTQAALLEAMQEYAVTVGGRSYDIEQPFFVLATQNPIEQEGTYPLPEAQLDRFMLNILINYPVRDEEIAIVKATTMGELPEPELRLEAEQIIAVQNIVRKAPVSDHVVEYATDLVRATRPGEKGVPPFIQDLVAWGAGPRAAQYLILGAKARAIIDGRLNVSCRDVQSVAHPVLRHRIFTNFNADSEGVSVEDVIDRLIQEVPQPDESAYAHKTRRPASQPAPQPKVKKVKQSTANRREQPTEKEAQQPKIKIKKQDLGE